MNLFKKKDVYGVMTYTPLYRLTVSLILLVILLFTFSSLILFFEAENNPALDTLFKSIWYGHAVVTTIGFGDVTPKSFGGQLTTMTFSVFGIVLLVAMGNSLNDLLFGHTQTDIENKELRALLERDINLNEANRVLNEKILESNLLANDQNASIYKKLAKFEGIFKTLP